jgi:gluconate 2-dehydrogenase gamma chain
MSHQKNETREAALRRRDILKAITAVPAAALVPLAPSPARASMTMPAPHAGGQAQTAAHKGPYQPKVLNEHEWKTINLLSDIIIPADDRSGSATQAGVPEFIDDWLDFRGGELLAQIRGGLVWLDMECNRQFSRDFLDCTEAQQKQMLDRLAYPKRAAPQDAPGVAFFNHLRDLVVSGFFSSEMGVKDLPYLGNQMLAHWDGCGTEVLTKLRLKTG